MTEEAQVSPSTETVTPETPQVESNLETTVMENAQPPQVEETVSDSESLFADTETSIDESNRPEWLPEKFKNPEDLSKSYKELEKKLGAHTGAPDDYSMEVEAGLEDYAINSDDPLATDFAKILKENGVNQKTYDEISNLYFAKMKADEESIADAQEHQFNEDCKELGEDRVQEIKESIKWAKEVLPEDHYELLRELGDKDLIIGQMIKQFHDAYANKNYVKLPEKDTDTLDLEEQRTKAKEMMNDPRYSSDPNWRKTTDELYLRYCV